MPHRLIALLIAGTVLLAPKLGHDSRPSGWRPARAEALELCGEESRTLMKQVGITARQMQELCALAERASALLTLEFRRAENEIGYCRVTLALRNNSLDYLNALILTTADSRFENFRFGDILPGSTGYTSASSKFLFDCDELGRVKIVFLWPGTVRVADRTLQGRRLAQFKPALLSGVLAWHN
ncbi:MAG: hypothetical protein HY423_14000 [Candidatus Lambdaproteobacteria bacterium]|nr:hypothetical protein [Candidatus Lambdaproteobacteria bacterium]